MALPLRPPIAPMLARLTRELPAGAMTYEPKWDGFRSLAFVDRDGVDLRSRHDRPLARYFPELVAGFEELRSTIEDQRGESAEPGFVLDGEIVLAPAQSSGSSLGNGEAGIDRGAGEAGFAALMSRLHPSATRVERLRQETPARYVAFDLLADGAHDLRDRPFVERRARLERLFERASEPLAITPATRDAGAADRWLSGDEPGIDGVVAKQDDLLYQPGRRTMLKVKRLRTAECVVAGLRLLPGGTVSSLLLGLYDDAAALRHVGVVTQLPRGERESLLSEFRPLAIPLEAHPWRDGFLIGASPLGRLKGSASRWTPDMEHDWIPVSPERVVEVGFDQVDGDRFRHPAKLIRWRPDRDADSCRIDQIVPSWAAPTAMAGVART